MGLGGVIRTLVVVSALSLAAPAGAATITEFEIVPGSPPGSHVPRYMAFGPDGNLWWTEVGATPGIRRVSPDGEAFPFIPDGRGPVDLDFSATGLAYWTTGGGLGRRFASGALETTNDPGAAFGIALTAGGNVRWGAGDDGGVCRFNDEVWGTNEVCSIVKSGGRVTSIVRTPDQRLWAALYDDDIVRVFDPNMKVELTLDVPPGSNPARIAAGPDGNVWVTMAGADAIDRFLPNGTRKRFPLPAGSSPNDIVAGPDGALWFTEFGANRIGRMTTAGVLTDEFEIPTPNSQPIGIAAGPDGALWFAESNAGRIGRLVPDGPGASGDLTAPSFIGAARFAPRRFAVVGRPKAKASRAGKRAPAGSVLRFSLSESAAVAVTVSRALPGRKQGRRCVAPGKAKRGAARCTRKLPRGTLRAAAGKGANKVPFSGKVGGRKLAPGRYRATLTARDAGGNASEPRNAGFTIVAG